MRSFSFISLSLIVTACASDSSDGSSTTAGASSSAGEAASSGAGTGSASGSAAGTGMNAGGVSTQGESSSGTASGTSSANNTGASPAGSTGVAPTNTGVSTPPTSTSTTTGAATGGAGGALSEVDPSGEQGGMGGAPGGAGGGIGVNEPVGAGGAASGAGGAGGTSGQQDPLPGAEGAGGSGPSDPAPSLACTGNELLCEDFEAAPLGGVPGAPWIPLDESCQYQLERFHMEVSDELAFGGNQAMKIVNKHDPNCRLSAGFDAPDEFWLRAYLYWETRIDLSNRETLAIDLTPGHRTADDPAVRFGYRSKAPCEDYAGPQITIIGIGGGEATGCGSRPLPQGEWYCFEAHVQQSSILEVNTFINGEAITYQSIGKEQTPSIKTESPISQKIDHVRLGIFSTSTAEGNVYVDDLAVAATRLGCPAAD